MDEIQLVEGFEKLLNGLNRIKNADIYVTGSNSRFLSSDILIEFRGRGDEDRIYPLSFSEFYSVFNGTKTEAWREYSLYGGMPQIVEQRRPEQKENFLKNLFKKVYLDDIISSNNLRGDSIMDILVNILASSVGSNTNPNKLANTFVSNGYKGVSNKAIATYIDCLIDAFLISKASRPDLKKMNQEQASLVKIPDSFKKIIVVAHETSLWRNEHGITIMNIYDFLLDKDSLEH